jgi:uracil phosphoribosyltransferase
MPGSVHVVDHPLVKHKLSLLRDKDTTNRQFRSLVHEVPISGPTATTLTNIAAAC